MVPRIFRYKKENRVALYRNIHSGSFICTYTDLFPSTNRVISFRNILISFLFFFFSFLSSFGESPKIHHSPLRARACFQNIRLHACAYAVRSPHSGFSSKNEHLFFSGQGRTYVEQREIARKTQDRDRFAVRSTRLYANQAAAI